MSFSQKQFFQIIRSWIHDLGTTRRTSSPGPRVSPRASSPSSESPGELYHWPVIITLANFRRIPHFLQNRHFERSPLQCHYIWLSANVRDIHIFATLIGPLCYLVRLFADFLANFCHCGSFHQIRHFVQNCHSQRGPKIVLFDFLQRLWRTFAIYVKIATFLGAPLPSYLTYS